MLSSTDNTVFLLFLTMASTDAAAATMSFAPVLDPLKGSIVCALDPPTSVLPLADASVGIPFGVPADVKCGFVCTGHVGCRSYNYRQSLSTPAQCELFTYEPSICVVSSADNCHYYQMRGQNTSCLPIIPNPFVLIGCYGDSAQPRDLGAAVFLSTLMTLEMCSQYCFQQGYRYGGVQNAYECRCDDSYGKYNASSKCNMPCSGNSSETCGGLYANIVLSLCDDKCITGCARQGIGKCDSQCAPGYRLASNYTCVPGPPCGLHCISGCAVQGPGKCDATCEPGWNLSPTFICKWCPTQFEYNPSTDSCYLLQTSQMSYSAATSFCSSVRARLAYVESSMKQVAIGAYLTEQNDSSDVWIGGCRTSTSGDGSFVWSTDCSQAGPSSQAIVAPFNYTYWHSPTTYDEWCVQMLSTSSWQWNDVECSLPTLTAVALCEVNAYTALCDTYCTSGCSKQGPWKCDEKCDTGWSLTLNYTCEACPFGSEYIPDGNSNCYSLMLPSDPTTQSQAAQVCNSRNSHLLYINSQQEQTSVVNFLTRKSNGVSVWIGGCRVNSTGAAQFVWSSNCSQSGPSLLSDIVPMTFTNWAPGQPDNAGYTANIVGTGQWCTKITLSYNWDDSNCNNLGGGAICQSHTIKSGCPFGFSRIQAGDTNNCYLFITENLYPANALSYCQGFKGHLVYINSASEMTAINNFLDGYADSRPGGRCNVQSYWHNVGLWIGGCRVSHRDQTFVWADQCSQTGAPSTAFTEPMSYTNWIYGQPDDFNYPPGNGEFCLQHIVQNGWNDASCVTTTFEDPKYCSLCELEIP